MSERPVSRPGLFSSAMRVFDLSLGEMLWSRRTIFMALVVGMPVVISLIFRAFHEAGAPGLRVNNAAASGPTIFGLRPFLRPRARRLLRHGSHRR